MACGFPGPHPEALAELHGRRSSSPVQRYRRQGEREWLITEVEGLGETVELASVGVTLPLEEIYERVFGS